MPNDVLTKSRSVLGATEITLMAPLKRGLIPALDARSYETRATLVLATLHLLGVSRREIDPTPDIKEVADAIRSIRSFRLAVVGQPPQMLLSVSFDGGWEPYMRRIWRDLGPLLDLIFCNCEGYLLSRNHGFRAYAAWVRQAQVKTGFYYEGSPLTVADLQRLRDAADGPDHAPPAEVGTLQEQARAAVVGLYRLTDMHPPRSEDGDTLLVAARLLLRSLFAAQDQGSEDLLRTPTEKAAFRWFFEEETKEQRESKDPEKSEESEERQEQVNLGNVQGGILEARAGLAHGCLVLVGLDQPGAVCKLVEHLESLIVSAAAPPFRAATPLLANLSFTYAGLRLAGVDEGTLEQLPLEFREGMEARAGVLGDWLHNHPSKWTLPAPYEGGSAPPVALSAVHALVHFTLAGEVLKEWKDLHSGAKAPLRKAVEDLHRALLEAGGRVLAVQPLQSFGGRAHFGFEDGISQPRLPDARLPDRDTVAPGDLLLGYRNGLKDPPLQGRLWDDSTFLVVRKLRQFVDRLHEQVPHVEARAHLMGRREDGGNLIDGTIGNEFDYDKDADGLKCPLFAHIRRANPRSTREDLVHLPRIVRRGMSYGPPSRPGEEPDVDRGLVFMAYNASIAEQFEVIQGWLAGGNSSGPGSDSSLRDPFLGVAREGDPRRFEWVPDPKAPDKKAAVVLPADKPLVELQWGLYAFVPSLSALKELHTWAAEAQRESDIADVDDPKPGADGEALLRKRDRRNREAARAAAIGSTVIARLRQAEQSLGVDGAAEQWKLVLEDLGARTTGTSAAVWSAIRKVHGGVLRTPYGVLVCSKALVEEVFANASGRYTVTGYNTRLARSFGEIYLGRDDDGPGCPYRREATPANREIMQVSTADAFDSAYGHTAAALAAWIGSPAAHAPLQLEVKDLVDEMLARFCKEWFGLPDGKWVLPGGWHWRPNERATCPGHFHSPSRYTFQPRPGKETQEVGEAHGQSLKQRVLGLVRAVRAHPPEQGRLGQGLFAALPDDPNEPHDVRAAVEERLAATLIGVMMGFLPTVDGNLRSVLYEWVDERTLWEHQAALRRAAGARPSTLENAEQVLEPPLLRTMQLRPVPEVVWRIARSEHVLGSGANAVTVRPGDTVVVSIVSATQEDLLAERKDPYVVFGGRRKPERVGDPHPTHACPGHDMAMGVMLGFLAALMDGATLRPALSPMALLVRPGAVGQPVAAA